MQHTQLYKYLKQRAGMGCALNPILIPILIVIFVEQDRDQDRGQDA